MKKIFLFILLILAGTFVCFADDASGDKNQTNISKIKFRGSASLPFAYYFSNDPTVGTGHISPVDYGYAYDYTDGGDRGYNNHFPGDEGRELKASYASIDIMLAFKYSLIAPFLQGKHLLTRDNNIAFSALFEITPVSLEGGLSITITPVPFLVLSAGTKFGSGWNVIPFNAYGMARNNYSGDDSQLDKEIATGDHFYGPLMKNWFSARFQFDTSALFKKNIQRWTHIIMLAEPVFTNTLLLNYPFYARPYIWQTVTTQNGWNFASTFAAGYKIPVIIDERKKQAEKKQFLGSVLHTNFSISILMYTEVSTSLTHHFDSVMSKQGWGSDFTTVKFGPIFLFDLPCNFNAMAGVHWANGKLYSDESIGNLDFMNREYQDWYVRFYRFFVGFGWEF